MQHYPLVFDFRGIIKGPGFVAGAEVHGRALLVQEPGAWTAFGVAPGGASAEGADYVEAMDHLRHAILDALGVLADECRSFSSFQQAAQRYFDHCDAATLAEWDAAREAMRQGQIRLPGMPIRKTDGTQCRLQLLDFTDHLPTDGPYTSHPTPALAAA